MKFYYIATIILYALLTPLAATGIPVSLAEPEKVPFSVTVTAALLPPALLALSVVGLRKQWKFMRCLLWKVTVFFALGGCFFLGLGEAWPAFLVFEAAAVVFLLIALLWPWNARHLRGPSGAGCGGWEKPVFRYKGEWAWDDAAAEYRRRTGKSATEPLTEEENDLIYRYAVTPLAYFLAWLLGEGFMSPEYYEAVGTENTQACVNGTLSPVDLLAQMDYQLHEDDLLAGAADFARYYFETGHPSLYSPRFVFDYWEEIKNPDGYYYLNDYSAERCERLCAKIAEAYRDWPLNRGTDYYEDEEPLEKVFVRRFNKELGVFRFGKKIRGTIDEAQIRRCVQMLEEMDEAQFARLDRWVSDTYGDSLAGSVMREFSPSDLYVCEPQEAGDAACCVCGEAEFEPEHGFSFSVRNGILYEWGYGFDFEEPYSGASRRAWEQAACDIDFLSLTDSSQAESLAEEGKLVRTLLIPTDLGGTEEESNRVWLTPAALREKERMDERVRAMKALNGGRLPLIYRAVYYDDKKPVVPQMVQARHDGKPSAFAFSVTVWT